MTILLELPSVMVLIVLVDDNHDQAEIVNNPLVNRSIQNHLQSVNHLWLYSCVNTFGIVNALFKLFENKARMHVMRFVSMVSSVWHANRLELVWNGVVITQSRSSSNVMQQNNNVNKQSYTLNIQTSNQAMEQIISSLETRQICDHILRCHDLTRQDSTASHQPCRTCHSTPLSTVYRVDLR